MKVTAIEEANDITTMRLDELFGSLRTFELLLEDNGLKMKNNIAFQGVNEETKNLIQKFPRMRI